MARVQFLSGGPEVQSPGPWEMALAPDPAGDPTALDHLAWLPAPVPGTAAQALQNAGQLTPDLAATLQSRTIWYRTEVAGKGRYHLTFDGLAGVCEVWLGNRKLGTAANMFTEHRFSMDLDGRSMLFVRCRPLVSANLPAPLRRQRWRPHLIASPHLRQARMSLLGHMPGWCPPVQPVGPYREVRLVADGPDVSLDRLNTRLDGTTGIVEVSCYINGIAEELRLQCAGVDGPLSPVGDDRMAARLAIGNVALWWPHTHGESTLYPLEIIGKTTRISLGRIGFRSLRLDTGADGRGFTLIINDVPVFCRGANWTNADLARLPGGREDYRPLLSRAREAGVNMVRVSGIMTHETAAFAELLDELGILYWQDTMFANFDYEFEASAMAAEQATELTQLMRRTAGSPSLAVVCGGSEIAQQAAMLSLPESIWTLPALRDSFPQQVAALRDDVIALPNSPWGGDLPFAVDTGVSHYFGVGAYQRPLEDARRANVRFAAECLAFAQLPQPEAMPAGVQPGTPEWKALVVRDLKADWDFEDTRDFYTALLYGVEAAVLKHSDPARYLALAMATPGEVIEATFAEWRRVGSVTAGALVWTWSDLGPGFGWGVIDAAGRPKPAWYALKRAFRPVQLTITDEGLNGLNLHLINETQQAIQTVTTLTAYGADGTVVIDGSTSCNLAPHSSHRMTSAELFGVFFDVTLAYRFGPPGHVATVATLRDATTGAVLAESVHFPQGRAAVMADPGLSVRLEQQGTDWWLVLSAQRLAQSVHIASAGFDPADDWFHLPPGEERRVHLAGAGQPAGWVRAINGRAAIPFG